MWQASGCMTSSLCILCRCLYEANDATLHVSFVSIAFAATGAAV